MILGAEHELPAEAVVRSSYATSALRRVLCAVVRRTRAGAMACGGGSEAVAGLIGKHRRHCTGVCGGLVGTGATGDRGFNRSARAGRSMTCPAKATALETKRPIRSARTVCRYKKYSRAGRSSGFWRRRDENRL